MDCNLDKCLKCSKKSQCSKYPILQLLNNDEDLKNKVAVLSTVCISILDKLDEVNNNIDSLKTVPEEKTGFLNMFK